MTVVEVEGEVGRETVPQPPDAGGTGAAVERPRVRRRQILIDKRYQLSESVLTIAIAIVLLTLLNIGGYLLSQAGRDTMLQLAPEMAARLRHDDRVNFAILGVCSLIFLAGTYIMSILASHRTAGPIQRLCTQMRLVQEGHYHAAIRLRSTDNHQELARSFNSMLMALQSRVGGDVAQLESIATAVRTLRPKPQAQELAAQIERLAAEKQEQFSS